VTWDLAGLLVSVLVLTVAGDQFVLGAGRAATTLRVRPTVVGAVIGGLGASLPELMVSSVASIRGSTEIAVGNLVGSIVANVCLALAIAALVAPIRVDSRTVRREAPLSVASVLLFALLLVGGLSVMKGVVLIVTLIAAAATLMSSASPGVARDELGDEARRFFEQREGRPSREVIRALAGLAFMLAGAEILVGSASSLAKRLGMAPEFIGLTIVAVGTSAPLVAIAIQAARRGNHDLAVGSVLGSNLFIALAGGALVGLLGGGSVSVNGTAVWLMASVAVVSWGFMARRSLLTRWEAVVLLVAYAATLPLLAR
jgi:cation:H+ antiporter